MIFALNPVAEGTRAEKSGQSSIKLTYGPKRLYKSSIERNVASQSVSIKIFCIYRFRTFRLSTRKCGWTYWANNKSRIFHYGGRGGGREEGGMWKGGGIKWTNVPLLRNNVIKYMNRDRSWKLIKISILKSICMIYPLQCQSSFFFFVTRLIIRIFI